MFLQNKKIFGHLKYPVYFLRNGTFIQFNTKSRNNDSKLCFEVYKFLHEHFNCY